MHSLKQRILSMALAASLLFAAAPAALAEEEATQELQNRIAVLSELAIMQGYPDGTFRPDALLTRAEFAKVAVAASPYRSTVPEVSVTSPYADVKYNHWAAGYVTAASKNGMLTGYPDATFRPDQAVVIEEVVTICLRILGYADGDFGASWPYGQMAKAVELGLLDGVQTSLGQATPRRDVMMLVYNMLDTPSKGGNAKYMTTFQYTIMEDITLIATSAEDAAVPRGKISTSSGVYAIDYPLGSESLYQTGDLLVSTADNSIRLFMPQEQTVQTYGVYSVLGSDILIYENATTRALDLEDDTVVYYKSQQTTLRAVMGNIDTGSKLILYYNAEGGLKFARLETHKLSGPITYIGGDPTTLLPLPDALSATVVRDSKPASLSDIRPYDVIYYSDTLNYVWVYCKKATGIYESALPNKDMPTSVVVSGKTYTIDGETAFRKLSSGGGFAFGDTITLLFGKDDTVVDVILADAANTARTGYVIQTGQKAFANAAGSDYTSFYVRLVTADGAELELPTTKNYEDYQCAVVNVSIQNGKATLTREYGRSNLSGSVDASRSVVGEMRLANDVKILDIGTIETYKSPKYTTVFLRRIDGVLLSNDKILKYTTNGDGEIDELFLHQVTGDYNSYGMMIESKISGGSFSQVGTYRYDINGVISTLTSANPLYIINSGSPAAFSFGAMGAVESIRALTRASGEITALSATEAETGNSVYPLYDKAAAYERVGNSYMKIPLEDVEVGGEKNVYAFYDNPPQSGGCVRVILVTDVALE